MPCALMFPLVRDVWRASEMDLSDGGRWITDASLGALAYLDGLASLRLTLCRFLTDSGSAQLPRLSGLQALDVSWTELGDRAAGHLAGCPGLTSLNLTGLGGLTDRGVASLLPLRRLQRLSLASTSAADAAPTPARRRSGACSRARGVSDLRWLELSNTRITDTGVGKLVAIIEDGSPYGSGEVAGHSHSSRRVFKQLEYLALSMTPGVGPPAVRQVRVKYGFDAPLPNAQRTLAKSNAVALEASNWVLRFRPTKERQLPPPDRTWEATRLVSYVAAYTREMSAAAAAGPPPPPPPPPPQQQQQQQQQQQADAGKRQRVG
ncbi:hypothetical protein EMIHUDRAFT_451402 [Emiliania huxleyi CCMP1516]|uniref:Uncharacterized protein n=2 Tax=Emiliania huxleyi TaxID=2903 RepID=A0A0D3J1L9_EMIH1|nr:hypothetical protein EMIHUDRAFT_451402 [Emiliania huxleyi CCMP1516]EOD17404.1 hypothetical protein EMIHUDRAFT_451402 [Emiliania huxleyi CCMP1516]|eukprot:XP_005769833.1 hypothetical protein EMIHUDRAFT_451402 [Emiliania huxleyi CCMP1516]